MTKREIFRIIIDDGGFESLRNSKITKENMQLLFGTEKYEDFEEIENNLDCYGTDIEKGQALMRQMYLNEATYLDLLDRYQEIKDLIDKYNHNSRGEHISLKGDYPDDSWRDNWDKAVEYFAEIPNGTEFITKKHKRNDIRRH